MYQIIVGFERCERNITINKNLSLQSRPPSEDFPPDMEKHIFFTPARFEQQLFYPRKCVTCDKSEFATKQRKMCLTTSMSKIRLPHIY